MQISSVRGPDGSASRQEMMASRVLATRRCKSIRDSPWEGGKGVLELYRVSRLEKCVRRRVGVGGVGCSKGARP